MDNEFNKYFENKNFCSNNLIIYNNFHINLKD